MSDKNLDDARRWRSKTVAFHVSHEEADLIDAQVAMSGLTKQDYITKRFLVPLKQVRASDSAWARACRPGGIRRRIQQVAHGCRTASSSQAPC